MIPLDEERYQELRESLRKKGFEKEYPLIIWEGHDIIVDGHHRYALCQELGIEPVVSERPFASLEDAIIYAIDHQTSRRNLTIGQITIVAMARYEAEEKIKARKRQQETQIKDGKVPASVTAHVQGPQDRPKGESAAIIAEKAGIKTRNVYEVRRAKRDGIPEIESMIKRGDISSHTAEWFVRGTPKEKQAEIVESGPDAVRDQARKARAEHDALIKSQKEAEAERRFQEELAKEQQELQEYKKTLIEQFGGAKHSCGLGAVHEMWCNSCNCAFDVFKPFIPTCCPACAGKKITQRDESWYPGKKVK